MLERIWEAWNRGYMEVSAMDKVIMFLSVAGPVAIVIVLACSIGALVDRNRRKFR
jgi:hypothetical protein